MLGSDPLAGRDVRDVRRAAMEPIAPLVVSPERPSNDCSGRVPPIGCTRGSEHDGEPERGHDGQLEALFEIGPATSQRIPDYRQQNDVFKKVEDSYEAGRVDVDRRLNIPRYGFP